jgi:hypothetical protein
MNFMKIKIAALVFFGGGLVWAADNSDVNVTRYLDNRKIESKKLNQAIRSKTADSELLNGQAVRRISASLKRLIGEVNFTDGAAHDSHFSPESLLPGEESFGCYDGLVYTFNSENKSVNLVKSDVRILPKTIQFDADFITRLLCDGSRHDLVSSVKEIPRGEFDQVNGFVTAAGQDRGAFPPDEVVVRATKGRQIFLLSWIMEKKLAPVTSCNLLFKEGTEAIEKTSFEALLACYGKVIARGPVVDELRKNIITVLKFIRP